MQKPELLTNLRRGVLDYCVLAALAKESNYVYGLVRLLRSEGHLLGAESSLYPVLSRLVKSECVESSWVESEAGPPRKYYLLTSEGVSALKDFRQIWPDFARAVSSLTSEKNEVEYNEGKPG